MKVKFEDREKYYESRFEKISISWWERKIYQAYNKVGWRICYSYWPVNLCVLVFSITPIGMFALIYNLRTTIYTPKPPRIILLWSSYYSSAVCPARSCLSPFNYAQVLYALFLLVPGLFRKRHFNLKIWSDADLVYLFGLCISTLDFRLSGNTGVTTLGFSQVAARHHRNSTTLAKNWKPSHKHGFSGPAELYMLQEKSKISCSYRSLVGILLFQPVGLLSLKKSHVTRLCV